MRYAFKLDVQHVLLTHFFPFYYWFQSSRRASSHPTHSNRVCARMIRFPFNANSILLQLVHHMQSYDTYKKRQINDYPLISGSKALTEILALGVSNCTLHPTCKIWTGHDICTSSYMTEGHGKHRVRSCKLDSDVAVSRESHRLGSLFAQ